MSKSELYCVVGSGPAGIACTQALLAAGKNVTILDSGLQLEPERHQARAALVAANSSEWTSGATAFLKEGMSAGTSGIPLKRAYGSDFPYRPVAGATPVVLNDTDTKPSYARGGLSTVWGGAVLPSRQSDIADWPISLKDLEPGYRAVLEWMPLAGRKDAIADFFPLHTDAYRSLPVSAQAAAMLAGLEDSRAQLNARGFYFGSSRLGVTAAGCVKCGLCMYGCPHNLIYSSAHTLTSLLKTGRVDYRRA